MQANAEAPAIVLDADALRAWPLPAMPADGDKEMRGHVLVLGGSRQMPGAVILAATAALRAGAGNLTIATGASVAQLVALAMPEARVIGLRENAEGGFLAEAANQIDPLADKIDAALVGPGMQDEQATAALLRLLLPRLSGVRIVLDACAMGIARQGSGAPYCFDRTVILTPHAGEMAHLTGFRKDDICAAPDRHALRAASQWNAVLALKGARTVIAGPGGRRWQHEGGNAGLAISGSGDTLGGLIAGLAARGAPLEQAACWGVALHALAGERLAMRIGSLGYLARELAAEVPALMDELKGH